MVCSLLTMCVGSEADCSLFLSIAIAAQIASASYFRERTLWKCNDELEQVFVYPFEIVIRRTCPVSAHIPTIMLLTPPG